MQKLKSNQYALRANISLSALEKLRKKKASLSLNGEKITIEQTINHILEKL